ncbi:MULTISPECIES: hypothetical protein [unclassified Salipiger]|uniref:hypothetical protein n=1 Tax=Salipiger sp. PrR002 TaxID=2706489 RepID=UPI0013B613D5|nr:hypothetical protein [Salipiger sp. PrR002]NDW55114.1 hypothetical protein [Salipiger sp. PrR004]
MTPDQFLVLGLLLAGFGLPFLVAAWAERRRPWAGALLLALGIGFVLRAQVSRPGGYGLAEIEDAIYGVIGALIR